MMVLDYFKTILKWGCVFMATPNTVMCRYNAVQYNVKFHTPLHWITQNINQSLDSQKTLHVSPSCASYGVSIVKIWEKIDRVTTAPQCMNKHDRWGCADAYYFHLFNSNHNTTTFIHKNYFENIVWKRRPSRPWWTNHIWYKRSKVHFICVLRK